MLRKSKGLIFIVFVGFVYIIHSKYLKMLKESEAKTKSTEDISPKILHQTDETIVTKPSLDSISSNISRTRIHEFLLSTPQTVVRTTPPNLLKDVKSPCFALDENFVNVGNINLPYALQKNYDIRCLPYVYIAGFAKCGTSDLHHNLMNHHLIYGFLREDQLAEYETMKTSGQYNRYNILGQMELVKNLSDMHLKESDFWDNFRCVKNFTLDRLSRRCTPELIIRSHLQHTSSNPDVQSDPFTGAEDLRQMVYIDSSPRMGEGQYSWNEEEIHWLEVQPFEFVPDRIHHATPKAKIIFMLRNPVSRVFSDYRFLESNQSAKEFHRKVIEAITWWRNCTKMYNLKLCAYGNAPVGLPVHNTRSCGSKGERFKNYCTPYRQWGCANSIDRLRISIYHIYLSEWLRVFPRENILFIKLEQMYSDKMGTIDRILKFLELPPMKADAAKIVLEKKATNKSQVNIQMLNETKVLLEEFFKPFNIQLSKLLGEDMYLND